MACDKLHINEIPNLSGPKMLLGFSGWMDGGEVSTGTVKYLVDKLDARKFADIEPEGFYIYSFPGSMEMTALFRPHTKITDGLIRTFEVPSNEFFYHEPSNLILFVGKEPNLQWSDFMDCIFSLCSQLDVGMMCFIGSVAGLVPHTREPRLLCSVSDPALKDTFQHYGVKFTNYEGPASFITCLTANAGRHGLSMASLVATIPAYVQGNNPKCIEAVTRRLAGILGLHVEIDDLRHISDEFERRLSDAVQEQPELAGNIGKLEEDYDNEIFDTEMGDLKNWLQQKGIRLD
ncbi:MAG: proteasome assembly chaperone family protein [Planctomycetota bacterium]|jgi:proteasome assembly chaperone (PAC2) family protein